MIITFGEAKTLLSKYSGKAGKCREDVEVDLFVKDVIQQLLFKGADGNLRKWEFYTQNGMFTAPSELELPVKFRIDGESSNVYDRWFQFYDTSTLDRCHPSENGIVEEPNTVFTAYDIPSPGFRLLAVPMCKEATDAHFLINGLDCEGRDVYEPRDGEQQKGEYLSIIKPDGELKARYSHATFSKITGIEKTTTKGYVRLFWYDPETKNKGLLGEYKPSDTKPSFRRFRIVNSPCQKCFKVSLLGRIRFCDNYADNDIIPISNIRTLKLMAQQIQSEDNDDLESASYKNKRIDQAIEDENQYKRTPEATLDFAIVTSPGHIRNII